MKYHSALLVGGFQLMIACSSTQTITQPTAPPPVSEQLAEKQVVIPEPGIELAIKKDTVPPPALKIDTLISIYYGPCYGKCEVYSLSVTNDGLVYWYGIKNISKTGPYLTKLSVDQKEQLEKWLGNPAIWSLANTYPAREDFISDFPMRKYHLKYNDKLKQIEVNHDGPAIINQLESNIQGWLEHAEWRRISEKQ